MLVALTLPGLIGLFLVAMERFEARVFGAHDSQTPPSRGTAPPRAASTVGPSGVHGARHSGNEADVDRRDPGRPSEGRRPWTHR